MNINQCFILNENKNKGLLHLKNHIIFTRVLIYQMVFVKIKKYDIKSLLDDLVSQIMKQIYQMSNK